MCAAVEAQARTCTRLAAAPVVCLSVLADTLPATRWLPQLQASQVPDFRIKERVFPLGFLTKKPLANSPPHLIG